MKKNAVLAALICVCIILALTAAYALTRDEYVPQFHVTGDVLEPAAITKLHDARRVELDGETFSCMTLLDVIAEGGADGELSYVVFVSPDGFSSRIEGDSAADCYITFTEKDGWRAVCPKHPVSANAKQLYGIVVVTEPETSQNAVTVMSASQTKKVTIGGLMAGSVYALSFAEGQADVGYTSTVTSRRNCVTFRALGLSGDVAVLTESGAVYSNAEKGMLSLYGNTVTYLEEGARASAERVTAVCADMPKASVSDVYYHAMHYLDAGREVYIIYIKGLTLSNAPEIPGFEATSACGVMPYTEEAWRAAASASGGETLGISEKVFDIDDAGLAQEIAQAAEAFDGAVIIAPLPSQGEVSYEAMCTVYYLAKG